MSWIFDGSTDLPKKKPDPPPLPPPEPVPVKTTSVPSVQDTKPASPVASAAEIPAPASKNASGSDVQATAAAQTPDPGKGDGQDGAEEEEPPRESWGNKLSYVLTLVGYAVGFGNIWRFPFLVHKNGGAAFLIPYTVMLTFAGIPIFFLELAIGQRMRKGALGTWNEISPYMGGLGLASGLVCYFVELYYNTLVAWVFLYFFNSFRSPLPWADCKTATDKSLSKHLQQIEGQMDATVSEECLKTNQATNYYFYRRMLDVSDRITDPGHFNPWMLLVLVISWILVWAILIKGIKTSEKVVYFTALFPYVVLLIFFIGNFFVPGWEHGYKILFAPDWSVLYDATVWLKAGSQIFFSLGVAYGCLIVFASYLPSNNNCYRDAVSVSIINCGTSLLAAIVIFPIFGSLGTKRYYECLNDRTLTAALRLVEGNFQEIHEITVEQRAEYLDKYIIPYGDGDEDGPIHRIIDRDTHASVYSWDESTQPKFPQCNLEAFVRESGTGTALVFVGFAEAVLTLPFPPIWSVLFFLMLLTLGIDSSFGTLEGAIAVFVDMKVVKWPRWMITSVITGSLFVMSLIFAWGWGMYIQTFIDQFVANWSLLIIGFFECIAIGWVYGLAKFAYDVKLMTGNRPNMFMLICWKFITPAMIAFILITDVVLQCIKGYKMDEYHEEAGQIKEDQPMQGWIIGVGYILFIGIIIWVPLQAIMHRFGRSLLKVEKPAYFPEDELRMERKMSEDDEEDFDKMDKIVMGKSIDDFKGVRASKSQPSVDPAAKEGSLKDGEEGDKMG